MPLHDHFHAPLGESFPWPGVHARWIVSITDELNRTLPFPRFSAQPHIYSGIQVEADIAELELEMVAAPQANGSNGHVATATAAPPATAVMAASYPDAFEIQIFELAGGRTLVGVVELVSPSNKDRPESRRAFAGKCSAYLQAGVGLVVVDVVTARHSRPHDDLVDLLGQPVSNHLPGDWPLSAVAYRPTRRGGNNQIDMWTCRVAVGEALPSLPLCLRRGPAVVLDLEATYDETCQRLHIS